MADDLRVKTPLYTVKEVGWYLNVPEQTLARWVKRRTPRNEPLITHVENHGRRQPSIPFIGLAEAYVIAEFRQHTQQRLKTEYVLDVLAKLEAGIEGMTAGVEHALASNRLALHGAAILINLSADPSTAEHVEVLTENRVFEKVVEGHLKYFDFDPQDGLATRFRLPMTDPPILEINPKRAFGQPVYIKSGARMVDVIDRFLAGDDPAVIAPDFRLTEAQVLDTVRAFTKRAAEEAA